MQVLQKLGFRFDLYLGNVILTKTLRRSNNERRLQTEVPVRVREAKEKFEANYRRPEPTNHEDEWLDQSENNILTRIAFFKWAQGINPSISTRLAFRRAKTRSSTSIVLLPLKKSGVFQTDFVGVVGDQSRFSILIQQDWIAGEKASLPEIRQHMLELGFRELHHSFGYKNSLSFYNDDFGVFDLRPANVVKMTEGVVIPIDCFVERLDVKKIRVLENL